MLINKKGFTTVELIVSFTLTTAIVILLFQLVFVLKDLYVSSGIKMKLLTKESVINSLINDDFTFNELYLAEKVSDSDLRFYFKDGTIKDLSFDNDKKIISYGSSSIKLVDGSNFGNISITTSSFPNNGSNLNGLLTIKIPIYHSLFEMEDFGVDIIHLYNSGTVSLGGLNLTNIVDNEKQIFLNNENAVAFLGVNFTDPGYYVVDKTNGGVIPNDPSVVVSGFVDTNKKGNYYITYTLYDMNNNIMDQKIRTVNVIDSEYVYSYKGSMEEFTAPISGTYKIELWGASGGGTSLMSGKGGYTVGNYDLNSGDTLYLHVGGKGSMGTKDTKAIGGYNGGGDSGISTSNFAGSGGGASDVRVTSDTLSNRIMVAAGGGGAGSRNDSSYSCNGGSAGGLTGIIGTCSSASYLGGAGTQTSGGEKASYTTNMTTLPTSGDIGVGGSGGTYSDGSTNYAAGGAGGGLYGGGGGARYAGGGGGSSYCLDSLCKTYSGNESFSSPNGDYEIGHTGDGLIKITLVSIN